MDVGLIDLIEWRIACARLATPVGGPIALVLRGEFGSFWDFADVVARDIDNHREQHSQRRDAAYLHRAHAQQRRHITVPQFAPNPRGA